MINSITITNHLEQSITLTLRSPEQSGFLVKSIEGLGPPKANINTTEVVGLDGSLFNSANATFRNVIFSLDFIPNPDIETTRHNSYKYFPLKKLIKIEIETDSRLVETVGYVESNEPNIFSSGQGCIISVICPDAYLYDHDLQITPFTSLNPLFEFPFSNESTSEKLIEFSTLSIETSKSVYYEGDSDVGILIHVHAIGPATDLEIMDGVTFESLEVSSTKIVEITGEGIHEGDDIFISTVKGNKYAILIRDTIAINILNALGQDPTWFELETGDNLFVYDADSGLSNLQFEIINRIGYEGI